MRGPDRAYYTRVARWSASPEYRAEIQALVNALRLERGNRILDLGCGTGTMMRYLQALGMDPVGIDAAPVWMGACPVRPVVCADAHRLPFPSARFHAAVLVHVVAHLAHPRAALEEVGRVLRPGGQIGVLTPNRFFLSALKMNPLAGWGYLPDPTVERHLSLQAVKRLLAETGFSLKLARTWGKKPLPLPIAPLGERLLCVAVKGSGPEPPIP
ncbi:MAG: class I SAM-dependent methyltransferase [Acidobacteriota bacterium]